MFISELYSSACSSQITPLQTGVCKIRFLHSQTSLFVTRKLDATLNKLVSSYVHWRQWRDRFPFPCSSMSLLNLRNAYIYIYMRARTMLKIVYLCYSLENLHHGLLPTLVL
uniref:Uncharacterized protein n=1 Tax=Setaria italica TaxID=4555 RepID=K4APL1_SETIT